MIHRGSTLAGFLAAATLCISASAAYAAQAKELTLAGITLGRSATTIMKKYGNPSEIRVGASRQSQNQQGAGAQNPFMNAFEGPPPGAGGGPSFPGMEGPPPGMGAPAMMAPTAAPGQRNLPQAKPSGPEVTWFYRFSQNRELRFILNPDGVVIQIEAFGAEWPGIKTSKGIGLGSTYKDVVTKYGYPESHQKLGMEMTTKYTERNRVAFTFIGKTVVGITIALMD